MESAHIIAKVTEPTDWVNYGVPLGSKVYCQCDMLIILRGTLIILRATLIILRVLIILRATLIILRVTLLLDFWP